MGSKHFLRFSVRTVAGRWAVVLAAGLLLAGGLDGPALYAQSRANDRIIRRAERAYYHVKVAGLKSIRCVAAPQWDSMVKQIEPESADRDRFLALVKQLHFEVTVGPEGRATVRHSFAGRAPDSEMAARVQKAANSIDESVTSFYKLWGPFAFGNYFSAPGVAYQLAYSGGQYRLTSKHGQTESVTLLNRAFEVTEDVVTTPQYRVTMRPVFSHGPEGYLLESVKGDIVMGAHHMSMAMTVNYRKVQGVTLPASYDTLVNAGGQILMQIRFADYRIVR